MTWHEAILRQPPAGEPLLAAVRRGLRHSADDPARALEAGLVALLGTGRVRTFASGRAALVEAFARAAGRTGRRVALLPAYTCYSVAAAACVAGLRVRLVDVDVSGRMASHALARSELEDAAALVVCNLFGHAEPVAAILAACAAHGVVVIDDAAQALGAGDKTGAAGSRGALGVLSFARGKPLAALGGGALFEPGRDPEDRSRSLDPAPADGAATRGALIRALAHDLARSPLVFRALSRVPWLGIGETHFETDFDTGDIDSAALCLAAALVGEVGKRGRARSERAERLGRAVEGASAFEWIRPPEGASTAAPRLALRAPDAPSRDRARAELAHLGATGLYPRSLDALTELAGQLAESGSGPTRCPGARSLAERLLTLPTHGGLGAEGERSVVECLSRIAPRGERP